MSLFLILNYFSRLAVFSCLYIEAHPHKYAFMGVITIVQNEAPSTMMRLRLKTRTVWCVFVRFENVFESGSKRKRIHMVSVWTVENGWKRIKMKTKTENIAGAGVCSMRIEVHLRQNVQFYERFNVDSRKRIKTVVWTRIDRCVFAAYENVYFWKRISVGIAWVDIISYS